MIDFPNRGEISYIKCEQILTISKKRLVRKVGTIRKDILNEIEKSVKLVLDFSS